ncbi:MAG: GH92 family glycosyl hydrolase [Bacteroidota bacterium]|nr:GH92 family glycosyl hydrolase [Bacteroidota bacterium]
MNGFYRILLVLSLLHCKSLLLDAQNFEKKVTAYVNPFVGTGAVNGSSLSGNNFPGATVPFGMVQLSPDTRSEPDWDAASGYDYNDKTIVGFSHTHLSGTGAADLFDVLLMPTVGKVNTVAGDSFKPESGYRSRFSHDQESARPGYYQVKLLDYNIQAELTATAHAGFHRYSFPKEEQAHVIIDLGHRKNGNTIIGSQVRMLNDRAIEGYRIITGWARLRKVYFYAEFSKQVKHHIMVDAGSVYDNGLLLNGTNLRSVLDFDTNDGMPLLIKIGFSAVSLENAKMNLSKEIPGWNFDQIVSAAENTWEKELGKIQVSGTSKQKEIFYTAFYHTFIQPNNLADVNGEYMASDFTTRKAADKTHYSTFSLWDSYRAANPLYTLVQEERTAGFINSMLRQYETYGYLPIWQLWGEENYCMIGNHSIPVIVDAVLKGIKGFDVNKAYEAVKGSSLLSHPGSPFGVWEKYKYMPENIQTQSVSLTLEMAYDDWCVAQFARKLRKMDDYNHFIERSQYFKNLYDQQSGFFRAKDDQGKWLSSFNPLQYGANGGQPFTEGNAWQYFWYVPHDVNGLIVLTGGDNAFAAKLDTFFSLKDKPGEINGNASGFIGQYAHGNEPSHHVVYLYDYAGQPWKSQYYAAKVMNDLYNNSSSGYAGNEDCGQMSAWYVFSAMGFYPVNPASGVYAIGSPALGKTVIQLSNGKTFTIIAKNASSENIYIQSAKLNGINFNRTYLTYSDITHGGVIEFEMGNTPNKEWGTKSESRPASFGF